MARRHLQQPTARGVYRRTLEILRDAEVPWLVGGAYALERYTGVARRTRDLDLFVRPADRHEVLATLGAAGYRIENTFPHWLAKAYANSGLIDLIFCSANGVAAVDDEWLEHAITDQVLGVPVSLCPPEEMIWSKAFVMERERYDGADVAHILHARGRTLDWQRLLRRFGAHWRVLLSHLVLYGFVYPEERSSVPDWLMCELLRRVESDMSKAAPPERICQGSLLSRQQYLVDIDRWGYQDARLVPPSRMTTEDVEQWTAAIESED